MFTIDQLVYACCAAVILFLRDLAFIEWKKPLPTAVRDAGAAPRKISRASVGRDEASRRRVEDNGFS